MKTRKNTKSNTKKTNTNKTNTNKTNTNKTNTNKTKTMKKKSKKYIYTKKDFSSDQGMITNIWGPPFWLVLHTMSFNYPIHPTEEDKKNYMNFVLNLVNVLPCKYCRMNLVKNFKEHPLTMAEMKNRDTFSRYIYELHEIVNKMLGKKSGLSYDDVKDRFENFRSRCTKDKPTLITHKGCIIPLIGMKKKCVLKIVPYDEKCESLSIDEKCMYEK